MAELTIKQQAFVENYLIMWDGAKAARAAGYSARSARQEASRLLTNDDISHAIKERLEQLKANADEVVTRLTDHSRGSLDDFIDKDGQIDVDKARRLNKMHLLKKYKTTKRTIKDMTEESVEIELHDPQTATLQLGKHLGLFVDKSAVDVNHSGELTQHFDLSGLTDEQLKLLANSLPG